MLAEKYTSPIGSVEIRDDALEPLAPGVRKALMLGPLAGFGLILLAAAMWHSPGAAGFVASIALATFIGGGKLVILAGAVDQTPVGIWVLAALIIYIDVATSLVALGGMHHLYRLPAVGRRIARIREKGFRILTRNPWMYRVTWLSLAGFVAVPFQATGAFVGVLLGRLMGLSRLAIVTATGCGSAVGSSALAMVGDYWEERITAVATRPLLGFLLVVVLAGSTILVTRLLSDRSRR